MTHETVAEALARGIQIQYIPIGECAIDALTGCPKKKIESFRNSSRRGSKGAKSGRPRKHDQAGI